MSEEFLTAAETANILSVSIRTIQRYCKQGRLNYKWITGKRHKELRIIPPIPVSDLPGVKRQKGMSSIDYVTRTDFENTTEEMPLDKSGKSLDPDDIDAKAAIIVPWTEQKDPVSFTSLFGNGPPYAPKKGPL